MRTLLTALLLGASVAAQAAPADDLNKLIDDHWAWTLRENPIQATSLGVHDYDDKIGDISLEAADRRVRDEKAFLARLDAIPVAELSPADRTNQAILRRMLSEDIEANSFGQRMVLFSNRGGWHQSVTELPNFVPLRTKANYESYLARLAQYPALNKEAIGITRRAVKEGYMLPCVAMEGHEDTISGVIAAQPEASRVYEPFTRPKPADITDAEWAAMQARAKKLIADSLNPAFREHLAFYTSEVGPKCAQKVGVSEQPNGKAYYDFRIRQMTTTDLDAEAIHKIGLAEVARIRADMEKAAKEAGFPTREAFIQDLRTNPRYYAKTPEELMEATARINKEIDGKMPGLFGLLPRLPYGIREIPKETAEGTTTAYYYQGSPESGIAGTYYVNTSKLDQRPLWEIPALSVHEAVPGHHHQIALQQELDMPDFRKHLAFFTAFVEGWGLYSESLGEEMGLYNTPARKMGQLSYQMWRATRLVVDTGMHAKGWSKQQAIDYMKDNTALSAANIEAEVNRYIANPGQALAYKIGELRIKALRAKAEKELGDKFDIRRFHDAVLGQGAVPLDALERQIDEWIAAEKARA